MASFYDDDNSRASSDNDGDEDMEDLDGGEADVAGDMEVEADNEDYNQDNEEDDDQDETQDLDDSPSRALPRSQRDSTASLSRLPNGLRKEITRDRSSKTPLSRHDSATDVKGSASHSRKGTPSIRDINLPFRPALREDMIQAPLYDIIPTIAAPHSTSINAVTSTPDMRWVFSGGTDGYVRKFNWIDTANGKSMLTVAQRHPFVDSVTKAGVLMSYWENEDTLDKASSMQSADDGPALSPVYSLAVHHQALWLLSGTESGAINLQSVRHDEGKRITSLYEHKSAVSVMVLSPDETALLSGSWDKSVNDWDLNTGQVKRRFSAANGQICAIEMRPTSSVPIPREISETRPSNGTFSSDNADRRKSRGSQSNGVPDGNIRRQSEGGMGSPADSLFGSNNSLFGDNEMSAGAGMAFDQEDDDEFSKAIADAVPQEEPLDIGPDESMADQGDTSIFEEIKTDDAKVEEAETFEPAVNGSFTPPPQALPHADEMPVESNVVMDHTPDLSSDPPPTSEHTFLEASMDASIRLWDRRQPNPITRIFPPRNTPPWCMNAAWGSDGNSIFVGRRHGVVDEYNIHKGLRDPLRSLRFPSGSGPVSVVKPMPNGKHLLCASYDILRLYDLKDEENARQATVPFLIVPGHRTGMVSQLYMDPTCSFMITTGGNRGWEGNSTEVLLGYEIGVGSL